MSSAVRIAVLAIAVSFFGTPAHADKLLDDTKKCRSVSDSLARLTCYDALDIGTTLATPPPISSATAPVTMASYDLRLQHKDYMKEIYKDRIEFVPTLTNATKKTVVGIMLQLTITDAFGDAIVDGSSKLDIRIPPGKTVESDTFFFWDDNPFIDSEVYDKLSGPVSTGAAKVSARVNRVVYSDGSIENY